MAIKDHALGFDESEFARRGAVSKITIQGSAPGFRWRVVRGWRALSIDQCLDLCSRVVGYVEQTEGEWQRGRVFDDSGDRIYASPADYKRAWARRNHLAALENSKAQWRKTVELMRLQYGECVTIYRSIYGKAPVPGFDTWRKQFRRQWMADRALCLAAMHDWKSRNRRFSTTENM